MKFYRCVCGIFAVLLFLMCNVRMSFATPPAMPPTWDNPVIAYIVFPAGMSPDKNNRFEIEVYCEAHYDIEWLSIEVDKSEEIVFDEELPGFEGPMKKGEAKLWRLKGTVTATGTEKIDDFEIPASARLIIKYLFPEKAVLEDIEKRKDQYGPGWKDYALREFERAKGKVMSVMKALPVPVGVSEANSGRRP